MTAECDHEWVPGDPVKGVKVWEIGMMHARCRKCGFVHPDNVIMPREVWERREDRKQYASDDVFERHLINEARRSGSFVGLPVRAPE